MAKSQTSRAWVGISILIFFCLVGGVILVIRFSTWKDTFFSDYTNPKTPWSEQLKLKHVLARYPEGILGTDISEYQGKINFSKLQLQVQNRPVEFLVIRATMGSDGVDRRFKQNWKEAAKLSLIKGAYHYYRPNENSSKQAENFIKAVKLQSGDLIPVLDIEKHSTIQSREKLREGIKNWLRIVEAHFGVKPMIYTGDRFFWEVLHEHGFDEYPIWVANYNRVLEPETENWVIWQFSEKGRLDGIGERVDLNILRDGRFQLHKLKMP